MWRANNPLMHLQVNSFIELILILQVITAASSAEDVQTWLQKVRNSRFKHLAATFEGCDGIGIRGFSENQLQQFAKSKLIGSALHNALHSGQGKAHKCWLLH
jgi:hypothetical protein